MRVEEWRLNDLERMILIGRIYRDSSAVRAWHEQNNSNRANAEVQ